jgi:CRP-like cAMP-binding protein
MNYSAKVLILRDVKACAHLNDNEIQQLAQASQLKSIHKNEYLYHKEDVINYVYIIDKGSLKCGMETSTGKILIKHIVHDGEFLGENVFTPNSVRKDFAQAMADSHLIAIPVRLFRSVVSRNVEFASEVMEIIVTRLDLVEKRMHNYVFKKAKDRILDFILTTGKLKGIKIGIDECLINHGMSHKEIAYLTDTSRQTVARVLGELKRENIIHFSPRKPGKILIRALV